MKPLTGSEEIVMKSVWELGGSCTLSQITRQAKEHEKIWELQTVATFLKHLGAKGYVRPYKDGRFLHYEIMVDEKTYKHFIFRKFLNFWWNGKIEGLLSDMKRDDLLMPKEIEIFKKTCDSLIV